MDAYLDAALSSRRTATQPAKELAGYSRAEQEFVLHWGRVVARDNPELAFQFTAHAPEALRRMDLDTVQTWLLYAMDLYDNRGQMPAIKALQDVADFAAHAQERLAGLSLDDVSPVLERFICGLSGRALRIQLGAQACTDTESIFLPGVVARLTDKDANFRLYKAMAVHQWAQNWYGTWRGGLVLDAVNRDRLTEPQIVRLHALETVRLDACLHRDLPGLAREFAGLSEVLDEANPDWERQTQTLRAPGKTVADSLALLDHVRASTLPVVCYGGVINIALVRAKWAERLALEKDAFRVALAKLLEEADGEAPGRDRQDERLLAETADRFVSRVAENPDSPDGFTYELWLDGKSANLPEGARAVMESIIQDLDGIPPNYLVAAGPGLYRRGSAGTKDSDSVWAGTYHEEGAFIYDEWDYTRQHHRKGWCVLREHQVQPGDTDFYTETLNKYRGLIKSLRRTFEVLRGEDRNLKRQPEGDGVDIDALVEAWADARTGLEMSERVFTRLHKDERNMAVMLMVDMSGSTKGWINRAEREALILLAESLETLGDRYAIYGFSGWTRKRCEVFPVKAFEDPWDDAVRGRVCAIEPKDYTRMGAPIRHLTCLFQAVEARTKVLITLSDGKPDDYDPLYRGAYGIEDTRQALFEARLQGVHPFCVTIDKKGADYLPHMYGAASYVILDDVAKLPLKVSDIYRRLTT